MIDGEYPDWKTECKGCEKVLDREETERCERCKESFCGECLTSITLDKETQVVCEPCYERIRDICSGS